MPRKPSAAVPRSETTAELIARISAERDAPPASDRRVSGRSRAGVLDAPGATRRSTARATGLPRQRTGPEGHGPRVPDGARRSDPTAVPRQRGAGARSTGSGRWALRSVSDVPTDPEPDDTPTVVIGHLEPIAPRQRGLARRIGPIAIAATALVGISIAIAQGFTFPGFGDPEVTPAVLVATVPEPAPTGPTVPAPVNGPQDAPAAVDEPATDPQSDVTVTEAAVPQSDYSY